MATQQTILVGLHRARAILRRRMKGNIPTKNGGPGVAMGIAVGTAERCFPLFVFFDPFSNLSDRDGIEPP